MKLIHIITGLNTGGAERALYNLLNGGLNHKFDNHIISLSNIGTIGPQISAIGVSVHALGMKRGVPSLLGLLRLRDIIKHIHPDLIQGWMYHGNLSATLARSFTAEKPALVWNIRHSLYKIEEEKRLTQWVIRTNRFFSSSVNSLLYNSHISRQQHEEFGFSAIDGLVIPNGIDLKQFHFSTEARQSIRTELTIPADALVAGHVARFHPMKDHALFLQAAVDIAQRKKNIHFLLTGRDVSFDNAEMREQIPVELLNRFHLLGERRNVANLMSTMDILCSSSWGEAFPNVLGEAMAVGIPCLATDVGDSALIIGDCGVVVPPRDKVAFVAGIESLLNLSSLEREKLGKKGRKRIEDNFSLGAVVNQYAALYEKIIEEKRSQ